MGDVILGIEVFEFLMLLILLYGACFETENKGRKKSLYVTLLSLVSLVIFFDALSYIPNSLISLDKFDFFISYVAFILPLFIATVFLLYLYVHLKERAGVSRLFFRIGALYCVCQILITSYFAFRGELFTIENTVCVFGEQFNYYLHAVIVYIIFVLAVILIYSKKMGVHDTVAAMAFILIPTIFVIVNMLYHELPFGITSLPLSVLVINTMLQSEHERNLINIGEITYSQARRDELTGLNNRLSYSESLDNLKGDGRLGIVFADVNGLKVTNDTYGHEEGDKLLKTFALMLIHHFPKENIYRISGDEFVVILKGIPEKVFESKTEAFMKSLKNQDMPIASAGFVLGIESDCESLIRKAEALMYEEKLKYYSDFPLNSRKAK